MNDIRKLMEAVEDLYAIEALHQSDIEAITEAEKVDLKKAFGPLPNDERVRRERMASNFHEQLQELIEEYYEGAQTFGEFHAPAIVQKLEKVLQQASFRNVVNDTSELAESTGPKAAFALYTSDDIMPRFPGWEYIKGIVVVNDQGNYQNNKKAAIKAGVEQGIIDKGSLGFAEAYEIEPEEIDALRKVVAQLEGL